MNRIISCVRKRPGIAVFITCYISISSFIDYKKSNAMFFRDSLEGITTTTMTTTTIMKSPSPLLPEIFLLRRSDDKESSTRQQFNNTVKLKRVVMLNQNNNETLSSSQHSPKKQKRKRRKVAPMGSKSSSSSSEGMGKDVIHVPYTPWTTPNASLIDHWTSPPHRNDVHEAYGGVNASRRCTPAASWHTMTFPTCNVFHETELRSDIMKKMANGFYRDVWLLRHDVAGGTNTTMARKKGGILGDVVALKTLRWKVSHTPHRMEAQRIDALSLERLSSSPNAISVYGYCGYSTMNGLAAMGLDKALHRGRVTPTGRLFYAGRAALALAETHYVDDDDDDDDVAVAATLVHRDVRASNFLMSRDGRNVMIHDFNLARFPMWDEESGRPCGFLKPECTEYRSPEECLGKPLTEKIDVYSLGNVLYYILTGKNPYEYPKGLSSSTINKSIVRGIAPTLPPKVAKDDHPATLAIIRAMKKCHAYHPEERPHARDVAVELLTAWKEMMIMRRDDGDDDGGGKRQE